MGLTLAFDTSGPWCGAALPAGGTVLSERLDDMPKGQGERLMPMLEVMLAETGHSWHDLDCIGVGVGPGNFTGVRIAVSAARGLSLGLGIPSVGVSGLEAQAYGQAGVVVSALDARRDQIYLQVFGAGPGAPMLSHIASLPDLPKDARPNCVGACSTQIAAYYGGQARAPKLPLAEAIARIAEKRQDPRSERPKPLYLRAADAAPARDAAPVILT
jgi:tRNA threonylcarbamoyl adenosine modification protein YeaZ